MTQRHIKTPVLDIAYRQTGPADAPAIVLLHGFPYSAQGYDEVTALLADKALRVIVPDLRGYGGTRFLSADTMRSGEQAALGRDLLDLLDALNIENAVLAGYDWGGRAACVVSALWPERVRGLVSGNGYNIQNIAASATPADPAQERRLWYQYYFHLARGHNGLTANRYDLCKLLWTLWSPSWTFDEATYARSAAAFENLDFVDVVIHSYRHRFGSVAGDPAYAEIEAKLATQPAIRVPTIDLQGADDGVNVAAGSEGHAKHFSGRYERRVLEGVGHNPPQEAPRAFVAAVLELCR
ncbi:MAG: alpha/beta hydrolase [Tardiphaga sp.]|nr:alpha/beta hydrolase [Tardiphaga sp.]